jgi:hypothetical protein
MLCRSSWSGTVSIRASDMPAYRAFLESGGCCHSQACNQHR